MKRLLTFLFLITAVQSYSQLGYTKGLIVTQTDDTICCLVPVASSFGDKIIIKKIADNHEEKIPLSQIKYLANGFNVFENVCYKKKDREVHKLMWLKFEGKLNLYLETITNTGISASQAGGTLSFFDPPTNTYVIRKADSTYLIEKENFIEIITRLISDNEDLASKNATEVYKYENIEALVKQYDGIPEPDNVSSKMELPVPSLLFSKPSYRRIVKSDCDDKIFTKVEIIPTVKGGESALSDSLIVYFKNHNAFINGKAIFIFLLTKNSEILDIERLSGRISSEDDFKEGLLAYSEMWTPALQNSHEVCAVVRIETEFKKGEITLKINQ